MAFLTFKGGVHPYDGKELSKDKPITDYLPKQELVYPLSQHIGAPAKAIVAKGDHVLAGQKIAETGGFVSSPIHASVSGTVTAVGKVRNNMGNMVDAVTVENDGKYESIEMQKVDSLDALSKEEIIKRIQDGGVVGMEIDRPKCENVHTRLKVVDLSVKKADGTMALKDLSFEIKAGEILGVAGIAGSGQKELCEAIAGLVPVETGAVLHNKENIIGKTPKQINNLGISLGFVPEDRLGMGLVASMGMVDNMLLKSYDKAKGIFVDRKPAKKLAEELVERLEIMTPNVETPVRLLSGGNVQKVLLGREIESEPSVLITAYPVRGLDINSSYTIYDLLNEQKKKGVAVMFIGEDLDVLLEISDRIMVLCHGEVTGIVDAAVTTKEELGLMMTGSKREGVKADG